MFNAVKTNPFFRKISELFQPENKPNCPKKYPNLKDVLEYVLKYVLKDVLEYVLKYVLKDVLKDVLKNEC